MEKDQDLTLLLFHTEEEDNEYNFCFTSTNWQLLSLHSL